MMLALGYHHILHQAGLCTVVRVVSQEFLIGKKFIFETTNRMKAVNRRYDLASFDTARLWKMSLELLHKGPIDLSVHRRHYIFDLDPYVTDAQHHISSETFDAEEAALFKLVV